MGGGGIKRARRIAGEGNRAFRRQRGRGRIRRKGKGRDFFQVMPWLMALVIVLK